MPNTLTFSDWCNLFIAGGTIIAAIGAIIFASIQIKDNRERSNFDKCNVLLEYFIKFDETFGKIEQEFKIDQSNCPTGNISPSLITQLRIVLLAITNSISKEYQTVFQSLYDECMNSLGCYQTDLMNFELRTKQANLTPQGGSMFKGFSPDEQTILKQSIQHNYTRFLLCYQNIATILEKIIRGDQYKNGVLMFTK